MPFLTLVTRSIAFRGVSGAIKKQLKIEKKPQTFKSFLQPKTVKGFIQKNQDRKNF